MGGHLVNLGFLSFLLLCLDFGYCINLARGCFPIDVSSSTKEQILLYHNIIRQRVANGKQKGYSRRLPPATNMKEMVWNDDLARKAQEWANKCINGHDSAETRRINSRNYVVGQNIAYFFDRRQKQRWNKAFKLWYGEVDYFSESSVDLFRSGNMIGNYSQVIWADTFEIGCGLASRRPFSAYSSCEYYVCNYGPAGNKKGWPVYKQGYPHHSLCEFGGSYNYKGLCNAF